MAGTPYELWLVGQDFLKVSAHKNVFADQMFFDTWVGIAYKINTLCLVLIDQTLLLVAYLRTKT